MRSFVQRWCLNPSAHLVKRPVEEHYGLVWLCPGTPRLPIPVLEVEEQADSTRLNTSMQVWNCSATRMIDNMLDLAHFAYTHVGTFGSEANKQVEHFALKELDETFTGYEYEVLVTNEGDAKAMSGARRSRPHCDVDWVCSSLLSPEHHALRERHQTDLVHDRESLHLDARRDRAELFHLCPVAQ